MNSALKGTLAVGTLTLVLAVVLASCGGGGNYGSSSSAATTTTNGASKGASGGTLNTIVIKETEMMLSPSTVTLSKPGTYAFKAENKASQPSTPCRSTARA